MGTAFFLFIIIGHIFCYEYSSLSSAQEDSDFVLMWYIVLAVMFSWTTSFYEIQSVVNA